MEKTSHPKAVAKTTATRDLLIGLAAGALVLGFLAWGIMSMSRGIPDPWLTGTIIAKHFTPQPEEQVTIGKGGLREHTLDGEYTLDVRVEPAGRTYTVWVGKRDYEARKIGEPFRFLRPLDERR